MREKKYLERPKLTTDCTRMADGDLPASLFSVWDYVVFGLFLLFSLLIGVFFAVKAFFRRPPSAYKPQNDDKKTSPSDEDQVATDEFLLGNRKMPMLPTSLSILASFLSANTVMGVPGTVYQYGVIYFFFSLHNFISIPIAAHIFIPIFHDLRITSVYEYLQLRFSLSVRLVAASIYIIQMLFYMAVVLYSPAIALEGVTGITAWKSVLVTGLICTAYTVMGGLKAVVWTDVFQMVVVYAGLFVMVFRGALLFGGFDEIWQTATEGLRINLDQFSLDPTVEYTYFSTIIGGAFTALTVYVSNQALVQRYLSLPTKRQAKVALYLNGPLLILIVGICAFIGLVIFKKYEDCDPLTTKEFKSSDEMMAAMIPTTLGFAPGLPGLMVACIFSASISTLSSGVNSLAAICIEDFMKPLLNSCSTRTLSDDVTLRISRILATTFGLLTIGLAFLVAGLGTSVVILALTIFGLCGGPLLGIFVQGVLCPWINAPGAFVGVVSSFAALIFIVLGKKSSGYRPPPLQPSLKNCSTTSNVTAALTSPLPTITSPMPTILTTPDSNGTSIDENYVFPLYRVSFFWYALIAIVVAIVIGSVVSMAISIIRQRPREKIPSNLVAPMWRGTKFTAKPVYRDSFTARDNEGLNEEVTTF